MLRQELLVARAAITSLERDVSQALTERDDATDFIDKILDEVLGQDRHEWTSAYDWDDALADVEVKMAALKSGKCLHQIAEPAAQGLDAEPKLNAAWKFRLLDGAPLSRDKYGCGSHPALPIFFEGVKCKDFFEALGIELRLWFAEYEMEAEAYEAMSDGFTEDGENYNAWTPKKPEGDGWCLVAIFDTEEGAACWWLRDAAFAAQAKQGGA